MTRSILLLVFALLLGSSEIIAEYFSGHELVSINIEFESNENTEIEIEEIADEDYLTGGSHLLGDASVVLGQAKKYFYREPILPSLEIPPEV